MAGDLDGATTGWRLQRVGLSRGATVDTGKAAAAFGGGALEPTARSGRPFELVALQEVVHAGRDLAHLRRLVVARRRVLALRDRTGSRARVEAEASVGLSLSLALDRVAHVLHVGPPRAVLGLGHASVVVLFRVLTGLADGLALKELALRAGRHDSPQLWVPRFPASPEVLSGWRRGTQRS